LGQLIKAESLERRRIGWSLATGSKQRETQQAYAVTQGSQLPHPRRFECDIAK
jgi:hypothetical protein